jgi:hypothetical protein
MEVPGLNKFEKLEFSIETEEILKLILTYKKIILFFKN